MTYWRGRGSLQKIRILEESELPTLLSQLYSDGYKEIHFKALEEGLNGTNLTSLTPGNIEVSRDIS